MVERLGSAPRFTAPLRFSFAVEVVMPLRPAACETMRRFCLGKPCRTVPAAIQPGQTVRWLFTRADDADFFQATFGGRLIESD